MEKMVKDFTPGLIHSKTKTCLILNAGEMEVDTIKDSEKPNPAQLKYL